ncbi:hypothetical protein AX16_005729, partial [Volvariella volvacea WC 439]
ETRLHGTGLINNEAMISSQGLSDFKCRKGTRTWSQDIIRDWAENGGGKVFLLSDPIGVGKTALCRSACYHFRDELCLGGTYFIQPQANFVDDFLKLPITLAFGPCKVFGRFGECVNEQLRFFVNDLYKSFEFTERWKMVLVDPLLEAIQRPRDGGRRTFPSKKRYVMVIDGVDSWNSDNA